jgi:myo-inositol-1-phosphate synthase
MKGPIVPVCAYAFKHPPNLVPLETAEEMFSEYIAESA